MAVRTVDTLKPNNSTTATGKGTFPVAKADDVWFNDGDSLEEKVQNGTIGASIQVVAMPTANIENFGKIVQYIGITDTDYTNGHFYKCVTTDDGQGGLIYKWIHQNVDEISGKQDTIDSSHKLNSDLVNDTNQNNKFVTSAEKTKIANALTEEVVVDKIEEGNMNPITSNAVSNIHKSIFTDLQKKTVPGLTLRWNSDFFGVSGNNRAWRYGNICFMYIDMIVNGTYTGSSTWVDLWDMPNDLLNDGEQFVIPSFSLICFDSNGRVSGRVIYAQYLDLENGKTYDCHITGTITLLVY